MAKRFTDTNKYKKPFIRTLPGPYKLLWDFLYHDCDHAGIWIVDFEIAQAYVGKDMIIEQQTALSLFNQDEIRIIELDKGKKWFLPGFIEFQYGSLSEKNRAHQNVISVLKKFDLLNNDLTLKIKNKPLTSPLQGAKEMEQEQEQEMEQDFGKSENLFEHNSLLGKMLDVWKEKNAHYPADAEDLPALKKISEFICKQEGISYQPRKPDIVTLVLTNWEIIVQWVVDHRFYSGHNLNQVHKYFKNIVTEIRNGKSNSKNSHGDSKTKGTHSSVKQVFDQRYSKA